MPRYASAMANNPADLKVPPASAPADQTLPAAPPDHVFTLGDLIDTADLDRLSVAFAKLCGYEIAILDADGRRLDASSAPPGKIDTGVSPQLPRLEVRWYEHVLGYVVILAKSPSEAAHELGRLIADTLAALCRAQGHIRKRLNELAAIYDLSALFARSGDIPLLMDITAKRICEVMNAKAASIRLLDEATGELVISGVHNLSQRYLEKGRLTLAGNPIDMAAFAGEIVYIADLQTDPRVRYPLDALREGIVSGLSCALAYRGHTVGVLRVYTGTPHRFAQFDLELLRAVAAQAAAAVVHSRLFRELREAEDYDRQIKYAAQVQRRMLPRESPVHARITFGHVYEPSLEVGGDFLDFLDLPHGNVGVAIADVVGKGLPSALMMASVRATLRAHARSIFDINEIIALVNQHMCRETNAAEFASLCYGVFAPDGSRFTYCNAGHPPPLLLRGDALISLDVNGPVIGVWPHQTYSKGVVELRSGDLFVFYTDGVPDAFNYQDEQYGSERLAESILRHRTAAAPMIASQLLWDVRRFAGLSRQTDDISLVVAKVN
jgi:sigma-B regulation protein RsbU (phosphoserine phosphatase)